MLHLEQIKEPSANRIKTDTFHFYKEFAESAGKVSTKASDAKPHCCIREL